MEMVVWDTGASLYVGLVWLRICASDGPSSLCGMTVQPTDEYDLSFMCWLHDVNPTWGTGASCNCQIAKLINRDVESTQSKKQTAPRKICVILVNTSVSGIWWEPDWPSRHCTVVRNGQGFSVFQTIPTGSWAHSESYSVFTWGSSPRIKQLGRESDHSDSFSVEVRKEWTFTSTPPCALTLPHMVFSSLVLPVTNVMERIIEKLKVSYLLKKFPMFFVTAGFVTGFPRARSRYLLTRRIKFKFTHFF